MVPFNPILVFVFTEEFGLIKPCFVKKLFAVAGEKKGKYCLDNIIDL